MSAPGVLLSQGALSPWSFCREGGFVGLTKAIAMFQQAMFSDCGEFEVGGIESKLRSSNGASAWLGSFWWELEISGSIQRISAFNTS